MSEINDKAWALIDNIEEYSEQAVLDMDLIESMKNLKAALPPRKTQEQLMAEFVAAADNLRFRVSELCHVAPYLETAKDEYDEAKEAAGL